MVRIVDRNSEAYKSLIDEYPDFEKAVEEYTDMGFTLENAIRFACNDFEFSSISRKWAFEIFGADYNSYEFSPKETLIAFDNNLWETVTYDYMDGYRDACKDFKKYYGINLDI